LVADTQQRDTRLARVHHSPAEEIGRGTGYRQERSGDQPAGGGFSNRNGLAAFLQALGDLGGKLGHGIHSCVLRMGAAVENGRELLRYTSSSLTASDQGCCGSVAPSFISPTRRTALAMA